MEKTIPKPYSHQIEALEFCKGKPYIALFMEQGTGKSKVAIMRAKILYDNKAIDSVIVISPNSVKEQWLTEQFPTHYEEDFVGYLWNGAKTQREKEQFSNALQTKDKLAVFSFNVEAFQSDTVDDYIQEIVMVKKPFVIIDESTKIKNGRRRTRHGKRGGAKRTNKILDFFENIKFKMILTGTPTPNSPFDLWSQFEFLKKDFFGMDYFYFTHHYGIMVKHTTYGAQKSYTKVLDQKEFNIIKSRIKKVGNLTPQMVEQIAVSSGVSTSDVLKIAKMEKYSGYKNLNELKQKISACTFFVRKEDCLDLPDKVYEYLYAEMGKEQARLYESLKKQMYTEYQGKELTVQNKMIMALRLQMITSGLFPYTEMEIKIDTDGQEYFEQEQKVELIKDSGKIEVLLDDLETISPDTFIIVWARFRKEIEYITERLIAEGYEAEKFYGGSDFSVITDFQQKKFRILVASALKGGEGLNLQHATLHYFFSNSFKADSRLQAEDRSHRIGQVNKVLYKDIICKNTIDEHIYAVLKRKENMIDFFRTSDFSKILN